MNRRRVLAAGAHPDDVEIICAGTLLLLAERGCEIHVASLVTSASTTTMPRIVASRIDIYGREVQPRLYVDISDVLERKLDMLAKHESQREWLRSHHGIDEYLASVRSWNATLARRASQASARSVAYAEAFVPHHGHAYPRTAILRELLGDRAIDAARETA